MTRFILRTEQTSRASRYGSGETQRMDTSKLLNGSRDEVLAKRSSDAPKSVHTSAVRSEAKKVDKRSAGKKAKTERPQPKVIKKSKSEIVCRYCGSDDLAPSFIKRRDRRCRKCFSKRYGAEAAQTRKTKVKK